MFYPTAASRDASSRDARPQRVRSEDREPAAEARKRAGHPVEGVDPHPEQGSVVGLDQLRKRGREAPCGAVDGEVEQHSTSWPQGTRASERLTCSTASKPSGAGSAAVVEQNRPAHTVDPERAQVVAQVVVRGEVPAGRMDDEAVGAQLAPGPLARVGAVPGPDAAPAADGVGEQEDGVARHRRPGPRRGGEAERRLERDDPPAEEVGQHAVDLRERAVGRALAAVEPLPARRDQPEHDGDRLVVREHERRQAVPGRTR